MDKTYYFPTVISSELNHVLADTMLPVAQAFLSDHSLLTWEWDYKNTYTTGRGIEQYVETQPFVEYIKIKAQEFLHSCGYDSSKIRLGLQLFVSEMNVGDQHAMHTHPNSLLSGVFYLSVPEGSSSIRFKDPRPFTNVIAVPVQQHCLENWQWIHIDPEPGLLLIWPSWLEHEVPKNHSNGRITMVFNLSWSQ